MAPPSPSTIGHPLLPRVDDEIPLLCTDCNRISMRGDGTCDGCNKDISASRARVIDNRYAIIRELGRGGGGVVYKALEIESRNPVALKMIRSDRPWDKDAWGKMRGEVAALSVATSEHTVKIYSFGHWEDSVFLAMEFIDGPDLLQLIAEHAARNERIPLSRAVAILRQVAAGLGVAHASGIIHDDIKPGNIVIESRSGRPVLIDFGLALHADALASGQQVVRGTPAYMAPERFRASPRSAAMAIRSDIYSLGCTAFELLAGFAPFEARSFEEMFSFHRFSPRPDLTAIRPEVGPIAREIARAMAADPSERFASCEEFIAAIDQASALRRSQHGDAQPPGQLAAPRKHVWDDTPTIDGSERPVYVLIVDDDPIFRKLAARCAQIAFFKCPVWIKSADSGEAAIEIASKRMPDLVLLDYMMPGLDGLGTLARLREFASGHRARVLVISGNSLHDQAWRFRVLGVEDFMTKPVDFQVLTSTITSLANRVGLQNASHPRPSSHHDLP